MRKEWKQKVSWNDGVFNSLERFVDSNAHNVEEFKQSERIGDLFDGTPPQPKPTGQHIEYMLEYANRNY